MKIFILIILFSLTFAQKSLLAKKFQKTNQEPTENQICDKTIGQEIGNTIFDKLVKFRDDYNIKTSLLHNEVLANKVQNLVIDIIKNPDIFYTHDGFETLASSDENFKYISESYARIYQYENPATVVFKEWLESSDIEQSFLREYDEGESFCCESGIGWYCAVILAKYK